MSSMLTMLKSRLKGTWLGRYLRRRKWNQGILSEASVRRCVEQRMGDASAEDKRRVIDDILEMARKYRFSADEYFAYHFQGKSEEERSSFCSDLNRIDICESLNRPENLVIFNDKLQTYRRYSRYYGRDFCGVKGAGDLPALRAFVHKHSVFILKPADSSCGQGIQRVDLTACKDVEAELQKLLDAYCAGYRDGFVAEELIVQDERMSKLHPGSVNTIRVTTIRCDDGIEVLPIFVKMGRGGSLVDNAGAGGIFGAVDMENGRIIAVTDKLGNSYERHPDSDVELVGYEIPRIGEAVALAKELAMVLPENRYTGWDLALTKDGWIMVEGNARGQFVGWQISLQKGCMGEINRILCRLGRKEMTRTGV